MKTNIGHTDAASGGAGFIKTVLALKHGCIPPSLHFTEPNPQIDFEASPFRVVTKLQEWQPAGIPRRAGVSSFGMGGTNAHVVLEQPPSPSPSGPSGPWQLLVLSAKTPAALDAMTDRLAAYLRAHPELSSPTWHGHCKSDDANIRTDGTRLYAAAKMPCACLRAPNVTD